MSAMNSTSYVVLYAELHVCLYILTFVPAIVETIILPSACIRHDIVCLRDLNIPCPTWDIVCLDIDCKTYYVHVKTYYVFEPP